MLTDHQKTSGWGTDERKQTGWLPWLYYIYVCVNVTIITIVLRTTYGMTHLTQYDE